MSDPDLTGRPYADHWRAALVYYDGALTCVCAHGLTFQRAARRAAARELAALEAFLRRLVLMMALALSLPPPKPRTLPARPPHSLRASAPARRAPRCPLFTVPLGGSAAPGADRLAASPSSPPVPAHLAASLAQSSLMLRLEKLAALIADPDPAVRRLARRLRAGARPAATPARQTRERPPWFAAAEADLPGPPPRGTSPLPPADTS